MGKKLSEASLKISKNQKQQQQQQFSSMIKALKPKVYITHSSRFKKLVQQLTGNNDITAATSTTMSSSSPSSSSRVDVQITADQLETSFDSSEVSALSSSSEATTTIATTTSSYSSSEFCFHNQTCLVDYMTTLGRPEEANRCMDRHMFAYQNLESLLFDAEVEQSFLYDYCYDAEPEEPEVDTYECELWGLL